MDHREEVEVIGHDQHADLVPEAVRGEAGHLVGTPRRPCADPLVALRGPVRPFVRGDPGRGLLDGVVDEGLVREALGEFEDWGHGGRG